MHPEQLIAHRGWQRRYPENTLPALAAALDVGARRVEFDIQVDADGCPWLCHDADLQRIAGQPLDICSAATTTLAGVSAHEPERFGTRFAGTPLPTLTDAVALLLAHPQATAYIELKRHSLRRFGSSAVLDAVMPALQPLRERAVLISFDFPVLKQAQARGWQRLGPVLDDWTQYGGGEVAALEPELVFVKHERLPDALPALPWPLAVYEIDDPRIARSLLARGVRHIETFAIGELLATLTEPTDAQ